MKDESIAAIIYGAFVLSITLTAAVVSVHIHNKEATKRKLIDIQKSAWSDIIKTEGYKSASPVEQLKINASFQKAIREI